MQNVKMAITRYNKNLNTWKKLKIKIKMKENKRGEIYKAGKQILRELEIKRVRELDSL